MKKLLLIILASPTLCGSLLSLVAFANPAQATEIPSSLRQRSGCVTSTHTNRLVCMRVTQPATNANSTGQPKLISAQPSQDQQARLDFTEEESDAAVALFGCDCPICINSLRQLRGQPPLV